MIDLPFHKIITRLLTTDWYLNMSQDEQEQFIEDAKSCGGKVDNMPEYIRERAEQLAN